MGSACDVDCQEPSIPSRLTALSLITNTFRYTKGWHLQRKLQSVVLSTVLPMLLPKVVLAFQGPWLKFAPVPSPLPCNGGLPQLGTWGPITQQIPTGNHGWGKHEGFSDQSERQLVVCCGVQAGWAGRSSAQATCPLGN